MLQKQPLNISFAKGVDLKSDPFQLALDTFQQMHNSVFTKTGRLTKRNGFNHITSLPNSDQTTLTTLNDNLIATGSNLYAFSQDTNQWLNQGKVQPVQLNTLPLVRVSTSQTSPDTAVAPNGLTCLVYMDNSVSYYQVSDSTTGQQIVARTALPSTAVNPRVFILGRYFIITYMRTVTGTPHLQYIAVPISIPTSPLVAADISTNVKSITTGYDAVVANNNLYFGWSGSGTTVKLAYLSSTLIVSPTVTISAHTADLVSMAADISASTAVIWISYWDSGSNNGYSAAFDHSLAPILASTLIISALGIHELTSVATNQLLSVFYEELNTYAFTPSTGSTTRTDFVSKVTVTQAGVVSSTTILLRSVGLASKAFIDPSGTIYMLVAFGETNQYTYFLMDSTGAVYMRLAYADGGGYAASQVLPTVSLVDGQYFVPYLITDFLATVNKTTDSALPANAIYTQTGINLAKFSINSSGQHSSEIAGALHLTGGQLWEYDGVRPVEHGFQVWPPNPTTTPSGSITLTVTGGNMQAFTYFYQFTYEWTDNQGNLHRSAPSIPVEADLSGSGTSTNEAAINIPTLRITDKLSPNPVRIVIYRWSTNQQVYYQVTSITSPIVNDTTIDYVTYTDTASDASILGNTILYTTGGVVENIAAPASIASALFKNRLFLIDAEDRNLLWYSKQVIENTPVEMSDLFTLFIAPTSGAQGSTGPMTALSAMDDKLIIFKKDAIYYLTGTGPDNTGAQNDFSDPIFITSSVGCANPNSIVLMPTGIMFQSDKGIWLLGRDLSTNYIGDRVESFNSNIVMSAISVPATNQVRFVLDNNITLMYDYYFNQWATHSNVLAISATLYQGSLTYLNSIGSVYQEATGVYTDGSLPVLLSLTTAWINLAGLQGFERFYFANLLGTFFTPFKINAQLAYDYNPSPVQATLIYPVGNYAPAYGEEAVWGSGGNWGGSEGNVFTARLFPQKQKCQSFQLVLNEVYDASLGVAAGQGLSLSGLALTVGMKKGTRTQRAAKSFG